MSFINTFNTLHRRESNLKYVFNKEEMIWRVDSLEWRSGFWEDKYIADIVSQRKPNCPIASRDLFFYKIKRKNGETSNSLFAIFQSFDEIAMTTPAGA